MERVELFSVEGSFWFGTNERTMLILFPDFSVPKAGWKSLTEAVTVVTPDGRELERTAQIGLEHRRIPDANVPIDKRWRVVMWLSDATKDDVPVGSTILVSKAVQSALLAKHAA